MDSKIGKWEKNLIPPKTVMVDGISVTWHPCLLAEVSPHDGPEPSGATLDVKRYNDLAHKNITIDDAAFSFDFSTFGLVAGTSAKIGIRSLVIDRSRLRPDTRVFVYSSDPDIMQTWIDLVNRRSVSASKDIPWRPFRPKYGEDEKAIRAFSTPSDCIVTVLEPTKLKVECCDGKCLIIDAPRLTRFWTEEASVAVKKPKVSVGCAKGKQVVLFDGDWGDSLELPMPLIGGEFVALAIGIQRSTDGAYGALLVNQRRVDGELSAGYEIRG